MNISIFGVGYVGLVTASCLAKLGHNVLCYDINEIILDNLAQGRLPFFEPGLDKLVKEQSEALNLRFTNDVEVATSHSKALFICVGTPALPDGSSNLEYLESAVLSIVNFAKKDKLIILKSTSPVGTANKVTAIIQENQSNFDITINIASNPEFLREGNAVFDFMHPDRIIVGCDDGSPKEIIHEIYGSNPDWIDRLQFMDASSAELTKYSANCFLAMKISFINEISGFAALTGADIAQVSHGIGTDPRIGSQFLNPGIGFGGSCFPKDLRSLISQGQLQGYNFNLLTATQNVNANVIKNFSSRIRNFFQEASSSKILSIWGLSFKPGTSDIRESRAIEIIKDLHNDFEKIHVYDPVANENTKIFLAELGIENIEYFSDKYTCTSGASALVICTEWLDFYDPDFQQLSSLLVENIIFDGRKVVDFETAKINNFDIFAVY